MRDAETKIVVIGKSVATFNRGGAKFSARGAISNVSVYKKRFVARVNISRTANRHRWTGGVP
jgi:hypothetical protein